MEINEFKKEICNKIIANDILPEEKNFLIRCLAITIKNQENYIKDIDQCQIVEMFKTYKKHMREFNDTPVVRARIERCIRLLNDYSEANDDKTKLRVIGHDLTKLLIDSGIAVDINTSII